MICDFSGTLAPTARSRLRTCGRGRGFRHLLAAHLVAQRLHHEVEPRDDEDAEEGGEGHAAEDRGAEGDTTGGAGAGGEEQRHDTEDERERGHQNRPEPEPCGLPRGLERRLAALP